MAINCYLDKLRGLLRRKERGSEWASEVNNVALEIHVGTWQWVSQNSRGIQYVQQKVIPLIRRTRDALRKVTLKYDGRMQCRLSNLRRHTQLKKAG